MNSIPTVPLLEGAAFAILGVAEGAVEGDAFSQLLGQVAIAPDSDQAALMAAPPAVGKEGEVLPIAALIAAVRSHAIPREAPSDLPEDVDGDTASADAGSDQPKAAATPAPSVPVQQLVPVIAAATATPVVEELAGQALPIARAPAGPSPHLETVLAKNIEAAIQPPQAGPAAKLVQPMPARNAAPIDRIVAAATTVAEAGEGDDIPVPIAAKIHAALPAGPAAAPVFGDSLAFAPVSADVPAVPDQAVEQTITQQLDLAHESEWLDQLATDIARTAGKEGSLRFRLHPETLGSLHVEMTQGAAGASIRLTADTEAARAIIADAQPRLLAEARAQGVRIAETHVDLGGNGSGHLASDEQRGRRGAPEEFLRTSGADGGENAAPDRPNLSASERYA
jgi:flagellar hook-length control protein FliK